MNYESNCGFWRCGHKIGLFLVVLFVLCFLWYFFRPVEQVLHLGLLKISFIGYTGMNFSSFLAGFVQSYIWGYIGVGIWMLVGCCMKRGSKCDTKK